MKNRSIHSLLLSCFAGLALISPARAWWNSEWSTRKKITIDASSIGEPIGTTVALIRLHDGVFQFTDAKDDASDIRFLAEDDKTLIPYHIERFDPLLNEAFIWVKIPDLKAGAKVNLWLYYGNQKAAPVNDPKGTYDADTVLVYHFNDHAASPVGDSSSGANNARNAAVPSEGALIGAGARFDGKNAVTIPASPSLVWAEGGALTWSCWIQASALTPNAVLFSRKEGAASFVIGLDNGVPYVETGAAGATQRTAAGTPIAANIWRRLAVVASGTKITLFLDGELYGSVNAGLPPMNSDLVLGNAAPAPAPADGSASPAAFAGLVDELRIAKTARPPGAIQFAATEEAGGDKAAKILTLGADEQTTSWFSGGYLGIILKSLTLDGWVVIGILAVMAAISWFVMITKASYLNGVSRGNKQFLAEWRHIARDLTALDHGDADLVASVGGRVDKSGQRALRSASVYRIYRIGAEEIRHRFCDVPEGHVKYLSSRSMQAIRASLDGGLVRETQALNSAIVLLTISIAGGPFLGLLGTVVGVMITFAAIAAAGDVNVNAIAPGIAAALVATVAGLAVAIPALFGYNYLLGRIKNATSDMHVFIDEFVARMAEFYGGSLE